MITAIYGGSFNPPHMGHVSAARSVQEVLKPDNFYIVPAGIPPHKQMEQGSPDGEVRMELCRRAFADIPGAVVSDMELRREGKSYSIDTVHELRERHPDDRLFLVIGTDMLLEFRTWFKYEELLELCTLVVLSREIDDAKAISDFRDELKKTNGADIIVIPHEPLPMSSTDIRERLRLGLGSDLLPEDVYSYIIRERLYDAEPELCWLRSKIIPRLKPRRVAHSAGVESEAVCLAVRWGEDPEKAAVAGVLHDMTKNLSHENQLQLCEKYGIVLDSAELSNPKLIHAHTGAWQAKEEFGVSEDIAQAIRWHTTGKPDMTLLEKIIYIADFIEPNRDYEGVEELRQLAYDDIDKAMALGLKQSLEFIRAAGIEPFRDTVEAYEFYTGKEE